MTHYKLLQVRNFHQELIPFFAYALRAINFGHMIWSYDGPDPDQWVSIGREFKAPISLVKATREIEILLTAEDEPLIGRKEPTQAKRISVAHLPGQVNASTISLTPLVGGKAYMLPVYNMPTKKLYAAPKSRIRFAMVGTADSSNRDFALIESILATDKVDLLVVTRSVSLELDSIITKYPRTRVVLRPNAPHLMRELSRDVDAIWIPANKSSPHLIDRLSGAIPLAVSLGLPIVCVSRMKEIYGLTTMLALDTASDLNDVYSGILDISRSGELLAERSRQVIRSINALSEVMGELYDN